MLTFEIFSRRICLTFGFFFILALSSLRGGSLGAAPLFLCIAHELGHLFAMKIFGAKLSEIRFYGGGIKITADGLSELKKPASAAVYLSGPLVNILIALLKRGAIGLASGFLAALNLLPVSYFDGGRLAALILPEKAAKMLSLSTGIFLFMLSLFAVSKAPAFLSPSSAMTLFFIAFSYFLDS